MIANAKRTENFDGRSLRERDPQTIDIVMGWAKEYVECGIRVTNRRNASGATGMRSWEGGKPQIKTAVGKGALHKKSDTTCFSSVEIQICARVRPEPYKVIPPASAAWSFNFSLKPR